MKLLVVPEMVNVASVWVDQVPADRRPPTAEPDRRALMVAFVGKLAGAVYNSNSKPWARCDDQKKLTVVEVADEAVVCLYRT